MIRLLLASVADSRFRTTVLFAIRWSAICFASVNSSGFTRTTCNWVVAYAQNGNIKPVANQTYIVTPYNVGFVGDEFVGELENNGLIM